MGVSKDKFIIGNRWDSSEKESVHSAFSEFLHLNLGLRVPAWVLQGLKVRALLLGEHGDVGVPLPLPWPHPPDSSKSLLDGLGKMTTAIHSILLLHPETVEGACPRSPPLFSGWSIWRHRSKTSPLPRVGLDGFFWWFSCEITSTGAYEPVQSCFPLVSRWKEVSCYSKWPVSFGYFMWLLEATALSPASILYNVKL